MYYDKRFRSSTLHTATTLKFKMSRLFQKRKKDKQQQRQILGKIDVNVNIYRLIKDLDSLRALRACKCVANSEYNCNEDRIA